MPGLDGLRALAVLAVIAYHLGLGWAPGGLLGVGVFFTLSGYLITDLLLGQHEITGRLQLADFWLRRARRLLPALFVMLAVVAAWVTLLDRDQLPVIRGAVASSAAYVGNWWLIAQHSSYFAQFAPPMPLGHLGRLWRGAVLPDLALAAATRLRWARGRRQAAPGSRRRRCCGGRLSAVLMTLLYRPGYDPTRIHDGTDTRAFAVLIGAALARLAQPSPGQRRHRSAGSDGIGLTGLTIIGVLIWRTSEYSPFLYRGGMVLLSAGTALAVGAAASPASRLGVVLGIRPLRWIGVRSYGIYLWHYPIIVLTSPANGRDSRPPGPPAPGASGGRCRGGSRSRSVMAPSTWRPGEIRWVAAGRGGTRTRLTVVASVGVVALASCGLAGEVRPPASQGGGHPARAPSPAAARMPRPSAPASRPRPPPAAARPRAGPSCASATHLRRPHLARLPAQPAAADRGAIRPGRCHQVHPGDLGRHLDRRDLQRPAEHLHRGPAADPRRVPGLLGAGPRDQ
jgi:peptidoglycan/LPS O-acetylase OafA/YrhL